VGLVSEIEDVLLASAGKSVADPDGDGVEETRCAGVCEHAGWDEAKIAATSFSS
jgi:hypothetical protein